MNVLLVLALPFLAVFILSMVFLNMMDKHSRPQKRLNDVLQNTGFKEVEGYTQFNTTVKKKLRFQDTDNVAYVYAGLVAGLVVVCRYLYLQDFDNGSFKGLFDVAPFAIVVLLPFFYKKWIAEQRRQEILVLLPIIIDLLIICLESGLSFAASIDKILQEVQYKSRFLTQRFQHAVYELNAGVEKKVALQSLVQRCYNNSDLKSFVSAIIQSESLGFSIVQTLKVQAGEVREKRRQMIRTQIAKMPVKLLFPLVFCIFPITCILLIGPGFIQIIRAF